MTLVCSIISCSYIWKCKHKTLAIGILNKIFPLHTRWIIVISQVSQCAMLIMIMYIFFHLKNHLCRWIVSLKTSTSDTLRPLGIWFRPFPNSGCDTRYHKRCGDQWLRPSLSKISHSLRNGSQSHFIVHKVTKNRREHVINAWESDMEVMWNFTCAWMNMVWWSLVFCGEGTHEINSIEK